jgi:hypothetical protein
MEFWRRRGPAASPCGALGRPDQTHQQPAPGRLQDDHPGPARTHNKPEVHEDPAAKLTSYPGTVRQLVVTGLGHDQPTVIITNNRVTKTRALLEQYARRMTTEQRLAEIIRALCADALSSTVNLNVDLDIILAVLAQALLAALRARLPGYATVTPDVIQRRFLAEVSPFL